MSSEIVGGSMSEKEPQKQRGRGPSLETELVEALNDMKRLDISKTDDASISRMKFLQTRVNTLSQLLSYKKRDKLKKLRDENDRLKGEIAELKAKAGEIPPEVTEKIARLETENSDLRQQLQKRPTEVVREVTVSDPAVTAENTALKTAVKHLAKFIGMDDFRKTEAVVDLFASDPAASKALASVFSVPFEDVKALMAKHSSELKTFRDAYRSPLAPVAQAIIAYRIKAESQAKKEKNDMRLAV